VSPVHRKSYAPVRELLVAAEQSRTQPEADAFKQ
jgi:hypothetical protein